MEESPRLPGEDRIDPGFSERVGCPGVIQNSVRYRPARLLEYVLNANDFGRFGRDVEAHCFGRSRLGEMFTGGVSITRIARTCQHRWAGLNGARLRSALAAESVTQRHAVRNGAFLHSE